jgi:cobyrinic acid a,c-diamide synthase
LHGAADADVAVVEGVMGLYDGRVGGDGFASTAHVAALTDTPVVLVVDVSGSSRSVGAVVHGMAGFDPALNVVGVVLNRPASQRHADEVAAAVRLPVLGVLPRDSRFTVPRRHLGLVPAAERAEAAGAVDHLAVQVAEHVDLDLVLDLARRAPDLRVAPWDPAAHVSRPSAGPRRPRLAMAGGRAFTFRYAEVEELLTAAGCDVVTFDPLADPTLPPGVSGLYLGGGFPEVHAAELSGNASLLADVRAAVAAGLPTVAECAGLLYLAESLDGHPMAGAVPTHAAMRRGLTLRYPAATAPADTLLTRADEVVSGHEFHRTVADPAAGATPAWLVDGEPTGFAGATLHASYLHTHWAGHPALAQRFADAVHAATPWHGAPAASRVAPDPLVDPLRHHGDAEASDGLLDFAVNVYAGDRPAWLDDALQAGLADAARYPSAEYAEAALARRHGRDPDEVMATAGAAEAFSLVARLRPWRRPVVVHPQFTEPHAALEQTGAHVTEVRCDPSRGFPLDPAQVPDDADLVVVGNPTNPTGVLHPATTIGALARPGRVVLVDEAFMDAVPGEPESLVAAGTPGLVVVRSLTKHWSLPGIRAGYLVADSTLVDALRRVQVPWSVSAPAAAAMAACATPEAVAESERRALVLADWRDLLTGGLDGLGVPHVRSATSFVLADVGAGAHERLRGTGIAVRRADTFPGLGPAWVRIAVRPPEPTRILLDRLADVMAPVRHHPAHALR